MDDTPDTTVDRHGLEVLSPEECWALVAGASVGRVAFVEAGVAEVLPVTHGVIGRRTEPTSTRCSPYAPPRTGTAAWRPPAPGSSPPSTPPAPAPTNWCVPVNVGGGASTI